MVKQAKKKIVKKVVKKNVKKSAKSNMHMMPGGMMMSDSDMKKMMKKGGM